MRAYTKHVCIHKDEVQSTLFYLTETNLIAITIHSQYFYGSERLLAALDGNLACTSSTILNCALVNY